MERQTHARTSRARRFAAAATATTTLTVLALACGQRSACAATRQTSTRPTAQAAQARPKTTKPRARHEGAPDCDQDDWDEAPGQGDCAGCAGPGQDTD